jgi:hypothetical protein
MGMVHSFVTQEAQRPVAIRTWPWWLPKLRLRSGLVPLPRSVFRGNLVQLFVVGVGVSIGFVLVSLGGLGCGRLGQVTSEGSQESIELALELSEVGLKGSSSLFTPGIGGK